MLSARVIPCLLYMNPGLYKTVRFKNPDYIGDPINAIKIFNDKEVDELVFLDIMATAEKRPPNYKIIEDIASECFMPLCYGGGITSLEQVERILGIGVEKVAINQAAIDNPALIEAIAGKFGNQSLVVSMDVKKSIWGKYEVYKSRGAKGTGLQPVEYARKLESLGAGELLLTAIDREGTWQGYDTDLIKSVASAVNIPVIANGGAGNLQHLEEAVHKGQASAVGLGSMVVYQKKGLGVLINFPKREDLKSLYVNAT